MRAAGTCDGWRSMKRRYPTVYVPFAQHPTGANAFLVWTAGDSSVLHQRLKDVLWQFNASMPVQLETTMADVLGESVQERRFLLTIVGLSAVLAFVLAAVGVGSGTLARSHWVQHLPEALPRGATMLCVTVAGSIEARGLVAELERALETFGLLCGSDVAGGPSLVTGLEVADPEDTLPPEAHPPGTVLYHQHTSPEAAQIGTFYQVYLDKLAEETDKFDVVVAYVKVWISEGTVAVKQWSELFYEATSEEVVVSKIHYALLKWTELDVDE